MRKRMGVVAATGTALALALAPAAGALPTWSSANPVAGAGEAVDLAMGSSGDVAVTWTGVLAGKLTAEVATRPPAGGFSAPHTLSPVGGEARAGEVAEDAAGEAIAAWPATVGGSNLIVEATTVVGGVPSTPVKLSAPGQNAAMPSLAADERGDAILAWIRNNGSDDIVQASFRAAGGQFGAPVNLSAEGGNALAPKVAIDAAGDATVVWERNNGAEEVVEEATRPAATRHFTAPAPLSSSTGNPVEPAVAMNAEGDTAVTWVHIGAGKQIQLAARPAGGTFGAPVNVAGEVFNASQPQVALDGRGDPTVVWTGDFVIEYASGTRVGVFSPAKGLAFEAWYPSIAEDSAGETVVGYATVIALDAGAALRPAGGTFGAAQQVSAPGEIAGGGPNGLNVAMSADGDGAIGFVAQEPSGEAIPKVSLLDAVGVAFGGVSIPATATAGTPVTFSAEPLDAIFPRPAVTWAFGDAATGSGDSLTHTFADPGTYSVAVTATVAPGDSVTQTGTIVVAAPPAPPAATPVFAATTPVFAVASLASTAVTADRHGHVSLKVACRAGGATCAGTVKLTLAAAATGLAVAARASGTPVTVTAGEASFSVAAGASATVSMALPTPVLGLLKRRHRLTFVVAFESHSAGGQSATSSGKLLVKAYAKPQGKKKH
jgi:hypothetical protein